MGVISKIVSSVFSLNTAPAGWTLGVDVSHWQGDVWWAKMKEKGVKFAICKMTDFYKGAPTGFVDDKYINNWHGIRENGILSGGYHWLQPKVDPNIQADFYLDTYIKYKTDLPPILDFEDNDWVSPNDMLWRAQAWLNKVEQETGRKPIVYTSSGYMASFAKDKASFLSGYPLWVANYIQRTYPTMPAVWKDWTIWQYSDKGDYPFYKYGDPDGHGREWGSDSEGLDMNWFQGTIEELQDWCGEDQAGGEEDPGAGGTVPDPMDGDEEDSVEMKVIVAVALIRKGASTTTEQTGRRVRGETVKVQEIQVEDSRRVWARDEKGWTAIVHDGLVLLGGS